MLHHVEGGEALVEALIAQVRAAGGFREGSPNYVGEDAIERAVSAFRAEGFVLTPDVSCGHNYSRISLDLN